MCQAFAIIIWTLSWKLYGKLSQGNIDININSFLVNL